MQSTWGTPVALKLAATVNGAEHDRLQPDWYRAKVKQVQGEMKKRKIQALLLLNATNIIYTIGYFHLPTERPLAALIPESGEPVLFVPELESDQVKLWWVKDYESYFDYPGPVNRIRWIFERVTKRGFGNGRVGVEEPSPTRLQHMKEGTPKATIVDGGDIIDKLRWIKDEEELKLMRRAMYFADFTVQAGRDFLQRNGSVTEDQILKASADALADKLSAELHDVVGVGVHAPIGGLVPFGKRSAFPHAVPSKDRVKSGDPICLSFGAQIGGYNVECERSFSIGKPSDRARRLFDAMLAAHLHPRRELERRCHRRGSRQEIARSNPQGRVRKIFKTSDRTWHLRKSRVALDRRRRPYSASRRHDLQL